MIFQVDATLHGLASEPSNLSPLIEYGTRTLGQQQVLAANYWNFFGWFDTYFLSEEEGRRFDLTMGPSIDHHRLHEDVRTVIGTQAPLAAQTFTSPPVSSESQAWLEFPDD
jgi:hypothetical protein